MNRPMNPETDDLMQELATLPELDMDEAAQARVRALMHAELARQTSGSRRLRRIWRQAELGFVGMVAAAQLVWAFRSVWVLY